MMKFTRIFGCIISCILSFCGQPVSAASAGDKSDGSITTSWIARPTDKWPQIVLTNLAEFHDHTALNGASSFLVQLADGRIIAATALHLLGTDGGVEPTVKPEELGEALSFWKMYPRTRLKTSVMISGMACPLPLAENLDWLLLKLKGEAPKLPSLPLKLRSNPISEGEAVFLVGVPYSEPDHVQNVYRGQVTGRGYGDRFRFTVEPAVDLRGFSGAPILDSQGLVAGVFTIWFDPKMQGDLYTEGGGEDAASALHQLESAPVQ